MLEKTSKRNQITIYYLLHLLELVKNSNLNRMDENNVSLMFAPSFFGDFKGCSPSQFQQFSPISIDITKILISSPLSFSVFFFFFSLISIIYLLIHSFSKI